MKQKGFTVIELIVIVAIVGIITMVITGAAAKGSSGGSVSYGMNGLTETRCIEGYKFVVDGTGQSRQIMDEYGRGAKCQ